MLRDVTISVRDPLMATITAVIAGGNSGGTQPQRLQEGVYEMAHWSLEHWVREDLGAYTEYPKTSDWSGIDWDDWIWRARYIVCDSPEQAVAFWSDHAEDPDTEWVIAVTPILKSECDPVGGWRWHKWGDYIGEQNPQCEYLFDEPEIEKVYTAHIYRVLP